jgi:hypothetical protein
MNKLNFMKWLGTAVLASALGIQSGMAQETAAASTTTIADLKLGTVALNGPVTMDDLKGKVVAVEEWGLR